MIIQHDRVWCNTIAEEVPEASRRVVSFSDSSLHKQLILPCRRVIIKCCNVGHPSATVAQRGNEKLLGGEREVKDEILQWAYDCIGNIPFKHPYRGSINILSGVGRRCKDPKDRGSGSARAAHPCRNFLTSMRAAGESAYIISRRLVIRKLVIDWELGIVRMQF
jgi:hypothetical protein